jgi:L-serine dehydratase
VISVFELFKIGVGPSSSHTVGPMRAAAAFVADLATERVARVRTTLLGSLAFTGKGHATDRAVILGLAGIKPDTLDPMQADAIVLAAHTQHILPLAGRRRLAFDPVRDIVFDYVTPATSHPNTLTLEAFDAEGATVARETWLSVGGGFIAREGEELAAAGGAAYPLPFRDAADLLRVAAANGLSIADLMGRNEIALAGEAAVEARLDAILDAMLACLARGLGQDGQLPGGLKVNRRAKAIYERLNADIGRNARRAHEIMDFVSVYAMAVNEENAAGGRVVTAPTNGAAGVIPAVLRYYRDHCEGGQAGMRCFLLTAGAIGALFKLNASISGAEVGCQGEVGVASSMAAAGLCAALGGTNTQIENAAEIAMEHHLGMTCDPVGGLVQIPCIERNAFGAIKAIAAASLALHGDGSHKVSLDQVIATMRQTGADMQTKYKETSLGGLAVNFVEC